MKRLNKEQRKSLRQQAENEAQQANVVFAVISPTATRRNIPPELIVAEAAHNHVRLEHFELSESDHVFGVPDQIEAFALNLTYTRVDTQLIKLAEHSDWLIDDMNQVAPGTPAIVFEGKVRSDPVVDFLAMTLSRVLGRLAKGVRLSGPNGVVNDDWLAWSLDYMDRDMFKITRVYDEPPPDFGTLATRFPSLRVEAPEPTTVKPWWRFW